METQSNQWTEEQWMKLLVEIAVPIEVLVCAENFYQFKALSPELRAQFEAVLDKIRIKVLDYSSQKKNS